MKLVPLTVQKHQEISDAFEESLKLHGQPNLPWIQKKTGLDRRTVKRAWEKGWPLRGIKPIAPEETILRERRARAQKVTEAAVEAALRNAPAVGAEAVAVGIQAAAAEMTAQLKPMVVAAVEREGRIRALAERAESEEANLSQGLRNATIAGVTTASRALKPMLAVADAYEAKVRAAAANKDTSIAQLGALLMQGMKLLDMSAQASERAIRVQRMAAGEPTEILKVQGEVLPITTKAEAAIQFLATERALDRARRKGLLPAVGASTAEEAPPAEAAPVVLPPTDTTH